ncbi:MAG: HAMP domain-containing sensor histidine kinase, partial [Thermoplasmatota archaeon]
NQWPVSAFVGSSVRARLLRAFLPLVVFVVLVSGSLSNRALSTSSNPALAASLIALLTAMAVGYIISRLSRSIGGEIDRSTALLLETQNELKQVNEKLHVLGSITRHDVLNRLVVVLGRLELLQGGSKDKETQKQISQSLASAQAIERIIQFTGEYQKIGVGRPVWIDVEEAFREAVRGVDQEEIAVRSEVSGIEVLADSMFAKVLANLVDNSLRHGKNVKTMKLHRRKDEDGLMLVYEDDGGGLSEEDKANLFQRGHGKHTGLGMFLSKEILEFSGMSVRETGKTGVGARFEIKVPTDKFRSRAR